MPRSAAHRDRALARVEAAGWAKGSAGRWAPAATSSIRCSSAGLQSGPRRRASLRFCIRSDVREPMTRTTALLGGVLLPQGSAATSAAAASSPGSGSSASTPGTTGRQPGDDEHDFERDLELRAHRPLRRPARVRVPLRRRHDPGSTRAAGSGPARTPAAPRWHPGRRSVANPTSRAQRRAARSPRAVAARATRRTRPTPAGRRLCPRLSGCTIGLTPARRAQRSGCWREDGMSAP